jgi:c-di-GMP-binding flagellar brake protein YcgR
MRFLKSLLAKLSPTASNSAVAADPYTNMEKLRDQHEWIEVKLIRTDRRYQSLILQIDIENNELLIDELFPPENLQAIEAGERVEISSQSRSKPVSFFTRILARNFSDGKGSWLLELPSEVGQNLNRSSFRVYVENEQGLDIEMVAEDGPLSLVHIINISAEGIKLSFAKESLPQLKKQQVYRGCLIRLPNGVDLDCDIELRSIYSIHTPRPHILGGGKLTINNPQQLVKLQQYLASIQRRQRRGESHAV